MTRVERSCGTCTYYNPNGQGHGECRRHPPTAMAPGGRPSWPIVLTSSWCGEWRRGAWEQDRVPPDELRRRAQQDESAP